MTLHFEQYPKQVDFKPKNLIIFLHGYGSNAQDLITLAPELTGAIKDAVFISPNAPFAFEGRSYGAHQWYSLFDRSSDSILKGFNEALPILEDFVGRSLKDFGLTYSDLILIGFSQGGMMAIQSSLVREGKIKAVISCSGYVVDHGKFKNDIKSKPPTLMTHGEEDEVVSFRIFKKSLQLLEKSGLKVEHHISKGLGHGIDFECIKSMQKFIGQYNK
jgi:phospholipase/carboxylesterase